MARSRAEQFLHKSVSAMIAAIEIYNKPDFKYREETFSILALNAWELLFKAKILASKKNKLRELYEYQKIKRKDGTTSKKNYIKRNRAGNPMTISIGKAIAKIENEGLGKIDPAIKANLDALIEIRDNSIHLINISSDLSKAVQEIGTATLQNFICIIKEWFNYDLSQYNFYLMPLAFFREHDTVSTIALTPEQTNIAKYFTSLFRTQDNFSSKKGYAVTLELNVKLKRSSLPTAARLILGNNPSAIPVTLSEEDIRDRYPWDYKVLTERLSERYVDFKVNQKYHSIRKDLLDDKQYAMLRFLDPGNPKSAKKYFFSTNIINEFDKHYKRI